MLAWLGTLSSISGAFLVALQFAAIGYAFFIAGALAWLYVAAVTRNKPLAVLNGFYLAANTIGIFNYWS